MRRVLVTGATGLVGQVLCRALVASHEVWGLTRRALPQPESQGPICWVQHDLRSSEWPPDMPREVEAIVHLAQSPGFRDFPASAVSLFEVNCLGVQGLLDYARRAGARVFVYVSSGGIYGNGPEPFKETDPFRPTGDLRHYFTTKYVGELLLANYAALFTPVILRPFFIYGAGQHPAMLIPRLIARIATGQAVTLHGEQGIRINPLHVSDMVGAILQALDRNRPLVANVAGPDVVSMRDLACEIGRALNRPPVFQVLDPPDPPSHLVADVTLMARELGVPKVRFADAIAEICQKLTDRR